MRRAVLGAVPLVGVGLAARAVGRRRALLAAVAPELRERSLLVPIPFTRALLPVLRRLLSAPTPVADGVEHVECATVTTPDGHVPTAHVYVPAGRQGRAALVWVHGGGLVAGAAARDHEPCSDLARELGLLVVSVEYRLAPEHPYPAALEDCVAVVRWLLHDSGLDVDPDRVAVGGASAGGNLAAALVHRLHDVGPVPAAFQLLVYPMLDDRTVRRPASRGPRLVWTPAANAFGWRSYLGRRGGGPDVPPGAAPARRADLRGLPPTWIGVGDLDLFHDEDVEHARRLRAAGVDVHLEVVRGMYHAADLSFADRTALTHAFRRSWRDALAAALDLPA